MWAALNALADMCVAADLAEAFYRRGTHSGSQVSCSGMGWYSRLLQYAMSAPRMYEYPAGYGTAGYHPFEFDESGQVEQVYSSYSSDL